MSEKELFNKGYEIKFHIETNELSHDDIRQQIYNLINPVNPKTDERSYKYWIREVFQTKFIIEAWENGDKLYMVDYSISGDLVTISSVWTEVEITYQPIGSILEKDLVSLQDELFKVKEELSAMSETKAKEVLELETKVIGLEEKITELNSTIVSQEEVKTNLESQLTELNSSIEDLTKYKVQIEAAEKEVKLTEVSSRYEKLLSVDVFKSEEVQNAIQELNTQKLNELVVNEVAKQKVEVASIKDESVTVIASKQEDLIAKNILQKYGIKA